MEAGSLSRAVALSWHFPPIGIRAIVGMEGGDAPAFDLGNVNRQDFGFYQIEQHIRSLAGYTIDTLESSFRKRQRMTGRNHVIPHASTSCSSPIGTQ
jgi:hypothetical protein